MTPSEICVALGITETDYDMIVDRIDALAVTRLDGSLLTGAEFMDVFTEVALDDFLADLEDEDCYSS